MGKSQRTKGAVYEREVAAVFSTALGKKFERHIGQARDGGNDLTIGPLVTECKRRKTLTVVGKWMAQAQAAAEDLIEDNPELTAIPIVVAREDHGESLVIVKLDDFLVMTGEWLRARV